MHGLGAWGEIAADTRLTLMDAIRASGEPDDASNVARVLTRRLRLLEAALLVEEQLRLGWAALEVTQPPGGAEQQGRGLAEHRTDMDVAGHDDDAVMIEMDESAAVRSATDTPATSARHPDPLGRAKDAATSNGVGVSPTTAPVSGPADGGETAMDADDAVPNASTQVVARKARLQPVSPLDPRLGCLYAVQHCGQRLELMLEAVARAYTGDVTAITLVRKCTYNVTFCILDAEVVMLRYVVGTSVR